MSPQPPRPNPAIYPQMYTKSGRLLHRARRRPGEWTSLCNKVTSMIQLVFIEGQEANVLLDLGEFDQEHANKLLRCDLCRERTGAFA